MGLGAAALHNNRLFKRHQFDSGPTELQLSKAVCATITVQIEPSLSLAASKLH
jgi:hypothetical protein